MKERNWYPCRGGKKNPFFGRIYLCLFRQTRPDKEVQQLTYDAEGLPGKAQSSLPSSVATAASCRPDTDDVLQPKHHDHHKLLSKITDTTLVLPSCFGRRHTHRTLAIVRQSHHYHTSLLQCLCH